LPAISAYAIQQVLPKAIEGHLHVDMMRARRLGSNRRSWPSSNRAERPQDRAGRV